MRPTTQNRHEALKSAIEAARERHESDGVNNPVERACQEVAKIWRFSPQYLRRVYYEEK